MRDIIVIAHDMRSTHNVGSLLRTAEGLGVERVYLTGYTPYPKQANDRRLPHIADKLDKDIHKTALGAEKLVKWTREEDIFLVLTRLKNEGYELCALEQTVDAVDITSYQAPKQCALLLGTEVTGIPKAIISQCDKTIVIPMFGKKESFNVVQAAAMAMFQLRFQK